jgi:hypothetical protein
MMGLLMVLKDILKLQHNHIQHKNFGFIFEPQNWTTHKNNKLELI